MLPADVRVVAGRADKEYESYLRKMEFWERQEAGKRADERRSAFRDRASKSADRSKDRQAKEHSQAEGGAWGCSPAFNTVFVF